MHQGIHSGTCRAIASSSTRESNRMVAHFAETAAPPYLVSRIRRRCKLHSTWFGVKARLDLPE